jgi:sterol desaturase/sphingolipid hydroxylase (fatty acid hydroxylase superfamily)
MLMKTFILLLIPSFLLMVLIEYLVTYKKPKKYYSVKDTFISIALATVGFVIDMGIKAGSLYFLFQLQSFSILKLDFHWWVWVLAFFSWDFIFYFKHLSEHKIRLLWAIHINHHSSEYYNLSVALRSAVLKSLYRYFFFIPMILIGFPIEMFLTIYILGKIWAFICHTQLIGNLGPLEWIFITPLHHRLHHSLDDENHSKNLGETLNLWDRLFGTFKKEGNINDFGVSNYPEKQNVWEVTFHEMKALIRDVKNTKSLSNKILLMVKAPGWQPESPLKSNEHE